MAYTKIGCGRSNLVHRGVLEIPNVFDHHRNVRSPSSFPVSNRNGHHRSGGTISASMQRMEIEKQWGMRKRSGGRGGDRSSAVALEEMERWMKETVVEIMRNLGQVPLLVHVYGGRGGGGGGGAVVTRAEEWEAVKGKWVRGEEEPPEGMIFVEELFDGGMRLRRRRRRRGDARMGPGGAGEMGRDRTRLLLVEDDEGRVRVRIRVGFGYVEHTFLLVEGLEFYGECRVSADEFLDFRKTDIDEISN